MKPLTALTPLWQNIAKVIAGLALGLLVCLVPLSQFQPSPLAPLETLAVQLDGRKKPLDTVAREVVAEIHGRTHYTAANGDRLNALQTYLSLWFNDRDWNEEPLIRLTYRPLKAAAGLDVEQNNFTFRTLMESDLGTVAQSAHQKQTAGLDLSRLETEALTVEDRLTLLLQTVANQTLPILPHPSDPKGTWLSWETATRAYDPEQISPILANWVLLGNFYRAVGPEALATPASNPDPAIAVTHAGAITSLARTIQQDIADLSPAVYPRLASRDREVWFNHLRPFAKAWRLYGLALIIAVAGVWGLRDRWDPYWVAMGTFSLGLGVQAYGFWERMAIADRPPVTNMYESVIWVGFGIAALALVFEWQTRARYYLLAAAPLSVICLILADNLPTVLDSSIKPLVPVLRDNFWLSIHVPTITLSYASFALSMGLGHILLVNYWLRPSPSTQAATGLPDPATASQTNGTGDRGGDHGSGQGDHAVGDRIRALSQLNYRVLQVGVLLLTTGIILGGIWAHFSWGRFWGWDPKETWAVIALLCYLVPLHGRLVGWLGNFGMAVVSVVCFNAVLMAWYGVNFVLGTGLHSYGFGSGGLTWVMALGLADLLFVGATALWVQRQRNSPVAIVPDEESPLASPPLQPAEH
jgi:cytochrome c-type biogenesis protein CcsB